MRKTICVMCEFPPFFPRIIIFIIDSFSLDPPDKDECELFQCDFRSTECENVNGSHHCKCREGFAPNLECRPVADLGMADGGIPDEVR